MLSKNYAEILSMLEYCLERNIELRYIELMRMGHLATGNSFAKDFVSMSSILDKIGESFDFHRIVNWATFFRHLSSEFFSLITLFISHNCK